MAIAFARVSIHSRSHGLSSVAGAAYRAAEKLVDERTGETHNFENRQDVCYSEILLPENADEIFLDRAFLWNAVELAEIRKDAQVAKDIILALPCEMDLTQQIELAKDFANYHFVSKGVVADIAIHDHAEAETGHVGSYGNENKNKQGHEKKRNPHAHIYITTRRLLGKSFDRYKARDLNPTFANVKGHQGFVSEQDYWGEQWRTFQTDYFKQQGLDIVVDENHLLPLRHQGRIRDSEEHYLKQENALLKEACVTIALSDPLSLINHLSLRYAVFSERQLLSLLFKNTETSEQFQQALTQVKTHHDIICLGLGEDGRARYTTRANYLKEAKLGEQADNLFKQTKLPVKTTWIAKAILSYQLSTEQQRALYHVMDTSSIAALVGHAGTGKSYLLKAANDVWQKAGFTVKGISVSGIAAKGLEDSSQISSRTIASFKQRILNGAETLSAHDVIVMDEAGMTDLADMAFVVNSVKQAKAKLVLVGDPNQLQPIGPGAPFRALVERIGVVEMADIRRQVNQGDKQASQSLALGDTDTALNYYQDKGALHWHKKPEDAMQQLVTNWMSALPALPQAPTQQGQECSADTPTTQQQQQPHPLAQQLILAHRNYDVNELNRLAREHLITQGWVSSDAITVEISQRVPTTNGWDVRYEKHQRELAVGDRILFRQNDKTLGVYNGEFATVQSIQSTEQGHALTVTLDSQKTITFSTQNYNTFDYGYAATVHKAQGVTVDNVYVYAGGHGWNRHLAYVALTRHRKHVELHLDKQTFAKGQDFYDVVKRQEVKDSVLDWPVSYAIRRGFEPESLIGRLLEKVHNIKSSVTDVWLGLRDVAAEPDNDAPSERPAMIDQHKAAEKIAPVVDAEPSYLSRDRTVDKDVNNKTIVIEMAKQQTPMELIFDESLAWNVLKSIKHNDAKWLGKYRDLACQKTDVSEINDIYQSMQTHMQDLADDKDGMAHIKEKAPQLAILISQHKKPKAPDKPVDIDWQSPDYKDEWKQLCTVNEKPVQWMVKFYDLAQQKQDKKSIASINQSITDQLDKVVSDSSSFDKVKKAAPQLARKIQEYVKSHRKDKGMEREF